MKILFFLLPAVTLAFGVLPHHSVPPNEHRDITNFTATAITLSATNVINYDWPTNVWKVDSALLLKDLKEYGDLTNFVTLLVTSGEFCRVRGHCWGYHANNTLVYRTDNPQYRECKVCGVVQERTTNPWPTP